MSTVFNNKLNKLIAGCSAIYNAPYDVVLLIQIFLSIEVEIIINKILHRGFEIIINKFVAHVISVEIEFRMNYFYIDRSIFPRYKNTPNDILRRHNRSIEDIQSKEICDIFELNNHYIAFIDFPLIPNWSSLRRLCYIQFIILDKQVNALMSSEWMEHYQRCMDPTQDHLIIDYKFVEQFFNDKLDVNNNGYITINEWISRIPELDQNVQFDIEDLQRTFYLILWKFKQESAVLNAYVLRKFITFVHDKEYIDEI